MCRRELNNIQPSSRFLPLGEARKKFLLERARVSSKIPCRYFAQNLAQNQKPFCPRWNGCRFTHIKEGKPYLFSKKYIRDYTNKVARYD
jgi:hypothetical protein